MAKKKAKKKVAKKKDMGKPVISEGDHSKASDGMNGNRVFIAFGKTINIGNYESMRVEAGFGVTVDDTTDAGFTDAKKECIKKASETLTELIEMVEEGSVG